MPGILWTEWTKKLSTPSYDQPFDANAKGCSQYGAFYRNPDGADAAPLVRDALALIRKYAPNEPKVSVFLPYEAAAVLYYAGKEQKTSMSNSPNDSLSPLLRNRILSDSSSISENDVIIISDKSQRLQLLDVIVLTWLQSKWQFCELERTPAGVNAVQLRKKGVSCPQPS